MKNKSSTGGEKGIYLRSRLVQKVADGKISYYRRVALEGESDG